MSPSSHRLFQQPWPEGEFRLFQLGFVVDDIVVAAQRWVRAFGVGPFHVLPRTEVTTRYRGTESAVDMQVAVAQAGPVQIELVQQHCDRPSIYRDLFGPGETGLHQLSTVTSDYDGTSAHYAALGYELAGEIEARGQRVAFFDTVADFGFMTEVTEEVPGFLDQLAAISATCASWDGTDPVRILTRGGYRTP
jgi:hypothetical protein